MRTLISLLVLAIFLPGCARKEEGLLPIGGEEQSLVQLSRFVRRLHLDLGAPPPGEAAQKEGALRLQAEGNTAAARADLADELLAAPGFRQAFVADLEGRVFTGQSRDDIYQLLCANFRNFDRTCQGCSAGRDLCADCPCRAVSQLFAERARLAAAPDDMANETTTEIERLFAGAQGYRLFFASNQALASSLFDDFLGRAPDPDEVRNVAAIATGSLLAVQAPAGILFGRYGRNYTQLLDILFTSEVYREALVARAFQRYLGRPPEAAERDHFAATLAEPPDLRPLIRALVSSREYFTQ